MAESDKGGVTSIKGNVRTYVDGSKENLKTGQTTGGLAAQAVANPGVPLSSTGGHGPEVTNVNQLPAGSVDPALLYNQAAANLGVLYNNQDYETQRARAQEDYEKNTGRYNQQFDWSKDDAALGHDRSLADLLLGRDRNLGDLGTQQERNTADLATNYRNLARNQLQAINAAGGLQGGALAQALAKRSAAQNLTQGRMTQDYNTATGRVGEDYNTQTGRVNQDYNTQWGTGGRAFIQRDQTLADLLTAKDRGMSDAYTNLVDRPVGQNALYQGTLTTQAMQGAASYLADDPNYEVVNGHIYVRQPGGGVTPAPAPPPPTPAVRWGTPQAAPVLQAIQNRAPVRWGSPGAAAVLTAAQNRTRFS